MSKENFDQALKDYQNLIADSARAGESIEFYNEVLNRLSEKKRMVSYSHPWNKQLEQAINNVHLKLSAINEKQPAIKSSNIVLKWILDNIVGVILATVLSAVVLGWFGLN